MTRYLILGLSLGGLGVLAPLGWWRREWLRYWLRKPVFLFGRLIKQPNDAVTWTSYVGRTLEQRYQVLDTISRGGFSVTYSARQIETGQKVVVKVLHRTPGQERWMRHRFAHEVAAMHTLNHPGVVRLLDSWIGPEGEACLAMPFLEGMTLRQLLVAKGQLHPQQIARIIEQLGAAVGAIHEHGIVHRDLKPENVIVQGFATAGEHVVVIDFGSSAARGPDKVMENTVTLTGSLHYLAPERLAGQYSPASDVYSLGVMVLEMLTGKRPAEMEVSPAEQEFIGVVSKLAGRAGAEKISEALQHQPARRPADVRVWAKEMAALLREV